MQPIHDLSPLVDPELVPALEQMPPTEFGKIRDFAKIRKLRAVDPSPAPAGMTVEDVMVDGIVNNQPDVPVRVYRRVSDPKPDNVLLWIHGGGFVFGDVNSNDPLCFNLAKHANCAVVSVEYRLAPEHPYPAPVDDCYAALLWAADASPALPVRPKRVAVAGASAGGCLAAGVALRARDSGGPQLCHQHLVIPVIDDRLDTPSAHMIHDPRVWSREKAEHGWRLFLGEHVDNPPIYAVPGRAEDLSGLPAATVLVEELDLLRDEAVDYANRLTRAGVPTELHVYPGTFHGHMAFAPQAAVSKRTNADLTAAVLRAFQN